MNAEPTLSQLRDELVTHIDLDGRVRTVEIKQATTETALGLLRDEVRTMKNDIVAAIEANKPKSPWPAVSALAAGLSVVLVLAAAIYTR